MITVPYKFFNTFKEKNINFQNSYDLIINEIDFLDAQCSCGNTHCLFKHAYYYRGVKTSSGTVRIRVLRVICHICKRTHAVLLSCLVPYSQITIRQHLDIINHPLSELDELMTAFTIDEAHIRYIKKQFKMHWKKRLTKVRLPLDVSIISHCFHHFKRQFMQNRNLFNIPYFLRE